MVVEMMEEKWRRKERRKRKVGIGRWRKDGTKMGDREEGGSEEEKGKRKEVVKGVISLALACPCLPVLDVDISTILHGRPFSITCPFLRRAEHCWGYVCEAPASPP